MQWQRRRKSNRRERKKKMREFQRRGAGKQEDTEKGREREKINKACQLSRVFNGNDNQIENNLLISKTVESRNKIKHDDVYAAIYTHLQNNPKINSSNMPVRPLIACVGVSIILFITTFIYQFLPFALYYYQSHSPHHYQHYAISEKLIQYPYD